MRHVLQIASLVLPLTALAAAPREKLGFDPLTETNLAHIASAYFAPENSFLFRMRMPDGSYREFDRSFERPDYLRSMRGWRGRIKGDTVTLRSGKNAPGGQVTFVFDDGTLTAFSQGEVRHTFSKDAPREPTAGGAPYYFGDEQASAARGKKGGKGRPALDRKAAKLVADKWKGSGRLSWPFRNPNENGCLYASLALLACACFFAKRTAVKAVGAVVFLAGVGAMAASASRGALLTFALGAAPVAALRAKTLVKSKAFWALAAVAVLTAAGWFATHDTRLLTRGFKGASSWSNQVRLDMWRAAPQMMADAPGGWGFTHVGRAYMDWYQPLAELNLPGSLMNEHLTRLVAYGRAGRFAWLFAWLFGLGLLGAAAVRTKNAVPLGVWLMFGAAGWFNPVFANPFLWAAPVAAAGLFVCQRPWRALDAKTVGGVAGAAVVFAVAILAGIAGAGGGASGRDCPVRAGEGRVRVKALNPGTWIVDDGKALGGVMACKDIRGYYVFQPDAPGVGYVRDVAALPARVHRLVLGGEAGDAWLRRITSDARARENLPREVVFISPPFPPSAVPPGLLQTCRVTLAVGEFAARYEPEYAAPPPWVTVVPGMELYLFGWMELAVGG